MSVWGTVVPVGCRVGYGLITLRCLQEERNLVYVRTGTGSIVVVYNDPLERQFKIVLIVQPMTDW